MSEVRLPPEPLGGSEPLGGPDLPGGGDSPGGGELAGESARSLTAQTWRQFRRHRLAVGGLVILGLLTVAVIFGPWLIPFDPNRIEASTANLGPSLTHLMGTDELGRDQLARILVGGRLTLSVSAAAVLVALIAGVAVGAVAGYAGGFIDNVLMRVVDIFYALPGLFIVILLVALIGPSYWTIVIAIAVLSWMNTARLVRSSFLSLKEKEFVEAARTVGASDVRIVVRHILPNALSPVIVAATLGVANAILIESALSFLGLGFQPPEATWGGLLSDAKSSVVITGHWWRGLFPGLMIFITVLSANFIGDGLRDALDPRSAGIKKG